MMISIVGEDMRRRRRNNNERKIIITFSICLLFVMTVGYAAFQTNLNITVKGNIKKQPVAQQIIDNGTVTTGDGLYEDTYEEGRYFYKGANPNNYITFNNETWRIISAEKDGTIKIIKEISLDNIAFDSIGFRNTGYCSLGQAPSKGCNAWAQNINFINDSYSGEVDKDAELNIYLNGEFYNSLSENDKEQVYEGTYNIGPFTIEETNLNTTITEEKAFTAKNKVALLSASEFVRVSTSPRCTSVASYQNSSCYTSSGTYNWITRILKIKNNNKDVWLLSPHKTMTSSVAAVSCAGDMLGFHSYSKGSALPVLYLKSNITLSGSGTETDPYTIN